MNFPPPGPAPSLPFSLPLFFNVRLLPGCLPYTRYCCRQQGCKNEQKLAFYWAKQPISMNKFGGRDGNYNENENRVMCNEGKEASCGRDPLGVTGSQPQEHLGPIRGRGDHLV